MNGYKRQNVPAIEDTRLRNRYCKINAQKFFLREYRYSIYSDGNIGLKGGIECCIKRLKKAMICVFGLQYSSSLYIDVLRCLRIGRDYPEKIISQVERYWN